jgi:hypothetical protein
MPIRRTRSGCCARAVSGIAARAALVNARKSRRFIAIATLKA